MKTGRRYEDVAGTHARADSHIYIPSTLEGRVRPCSCVTPETATSHTHIRCKNMHQHRDKIPTYNISIGNCASTNMCVSFVPQGGV